MKKLVSQNLLILFAVVTGLFSFFFDSPLLFDCASMVSSQFLRLFKLLAAPIVFFSLASSIASMRGLQEMRSLGGRILLYTLSTTLLAATISFILFILIQPVCCSNAFLTESAPDTPQGTYLSFLGQIIPENAVRAFLENNIISVAFLGGITGVACLQLPEEKREQLQSFFDNLFALTLKFAEMIISLMPLGIWAFTTSFVHDVKMGHAEVDKLLLYSFCVLGANLFQAFVVLPTFLLWKKISPLRTFKAVYPALMTAFFTKSSNAALPIAMQCAEENLKISPRVSKICFPLCSVINMNACASFIFTTVLFVAISHGLTFSYFEMFIWIFLATLAAIGNAGVPMGCYFLTSAFLTGLGVPLNTLGLILPLYTFFDMVETAVNVWSDSSIATLVDKDLQNRDKKEELQSCVNF